MRRVLQRWLGMTSAEKQSASEAARREMNNEGGAWWRESKEKDATKPAPAEAPAEEGEYVLRWRESSPAPAQRLSALI